MTGLGHEAFMKSIESFAKIQELVQRAVGDQLQSCSMLTTFEDHPAVEALNRYFTPSREADASDICEFNVAVDPHGYLAEAQGSNLVHTLDNKVVYFERIYADESEDYE